VSSLEEFETVVNESACVNQAQLIGKENETSSVSVGDWQQNLNTYLKLFNGFDAGNMFAKISTETDEVEFNRLKSSIKDLPKWFAQSIVPNGFL
jgi:hypothetical protein